MCSDDRPTVRRAILSIVSQIFPSAYSINISENNINEQNNFIKGHASKVNNNVKIESNFISRGESGVDYQQDVISGVGSEGERVGGSGWGLGGVCWAGGGARTGKYTQSAASTQLI